MIDKSPARDAQVVPTCVISFKILFVGPRIHERSQAYQRPVLNARRDLALAVWWSTFLHPRWHEVCVLSVRHTS